MQRKMQSMGGAGVVPTPAVGELVFLNADSIDGGSWYQWIDGRTVLPNGDHPFLVLMAVDAGLRAVALLSREGHGDRIMIAPVDVRSGGRTELNLLHYLGTALVQASSASMKRARAAQLSARAFVKPEALARANEFIGRWDL